SPPRSTLFPYRRSSDLGGVYSNRRYTPSYWKVLESTGQRAHNWSTPGSDTLGIGNSDVRTNVFWHYAIWEDEDYTWETTPDIRRDRKSTRLNSSHVKIS